MKIEAYEAWWLKDLSLRKFKRLRRGLGFCQDGVYYDVDGWNTLLHKVIKIQRGDRVWVPYVAEWGTVTNVAFQAVPVLSRWLKREIGTVVESFVIYACADSRMYCVYDLEHLMDPRCPRDSAEFAVLEERLNRHASSPNNWP